LGWGSGNFSTPSQAQSAYEVLWAFHPAENGSPESGVIQGADGNIYGSTWNVFDGSNHMWLYRWEPTGILTWMSDPRTGWDPDPSPLIETADGYLFFHKRDGTCGEGSDGCLTRVRWGMPWTHDYSHIVRWYYEPDAVGHYPYERVLEAADGFFYGVGNEHEEYDLGAVFRLDLSKPERQRATFLFGFERGTGPYPQLILGRDGYVYQFRGGERGDLYRRLSDGNFYSTYEVIEGSDGALYRIESGGAFGQGEIVRVTRSGVRHVLHSFSGAEGRACGPAPLVYCGSRALVEADGYMYGTTLYGGLHAGGVLFRLHVPELSRVDLVQTAVSRPPALIAPAWSFDVTDTVVNRGSEASANTITRFFLSSDLGRGPDDVQLKGGRYLSELVPHQSSTDTGNVTVPAGMAPGVYRLLACADATGERAEWNEANNCRIADDTVTVLRPDVVTTAVAPLSATVNPGAKLGIADTVQNISAVGALATASRFYLSVDSVRDAGDALLNGKRSIPVLESGFSSVGSSNPTIPLTVAEGTYRVLACADDLKKLTETNETNNCLATSTTVTVGWPDLVVGSVNPLSPTVSRGAKIRVTDTTANHGTIPTGGFVVQYFLSADALKDPSDVLLTGKRSIGNLDPSTQSTGDKNVTVPLTTPTGPYFVIACADDANKVPEKVETNNCRASATVLMIR
jgi:hypothetical protein